MAWIVPVTGLPYIEFPRPLVGKDQKTKMEPNIRITFNKPDTQEGLRMVLNDEARKLFPATLTVSFDKDDTWVSPPAKMGNEGLHISTSGRQHVVSIQKYGCLAHRAGNYTLTPDGEGYLLEKI